MQVMCFCIRWRESAQYHEKQESSSAFPFNHKFNQQKYSVEKYKYKTRPFTAAVKVSGSALLCQSERASSFTL